MIQSNQITLNLGYKNIKVVRFSQFELDKEFDKDRFPLVEFQTTFNFKIDEKDEIIVCTIEVKIKILETGEDFAELIVENSFNISPLKELINIDSNQYNIPIPILQTIASICGSTVRGILFERLRGSTIQNEVYPLIDITQLFTENIKVSS